jgi:hypothetical protein
MDLTMTYGAMEGWPAIWNDVEGWWKPNSKWQTMDTTELGMNAKPLTKAGFDKRFPDHPLADLPSSAFPGGPYADSVKPAYEE